MRAKQNHLLLLVLCLTCWLGAQGITRSPKGLLQVEDLTFGLSYWSQDWKHNASQTARPETVSFLGEGGEETAEGIRRTGFFNVTEEWQFHVSETYRQLSPQKVSLSLSLTSDTGIPTSILALCASMPTDLYRANPALFNGKPILLATGKQQDFPKRQNQLILNLKRGRLVIAGDFALTIRPARHVEIRLRFRAWGKVRNTSQTLTFTYEPYVQSATLNLAPITNMGFKDEMADDQKGGWTDQGPDNDLRMMKPGLQTLGGLPFQIIDPLHNEGKSCLVMGGKHRPYFPRKATMSVPNLNAQYLYLLNGLAWAPAKETPAGKVIVRYDDGTQQETVLKTGVDTGNFWGASHLKNAQVIWKSRNSQAAIGLYASRIPLQRSRKVTALEFQSLDQVWMILAATLSDQSIQIADSHCVTMKPDKNWLALDAPFKTVPGSVADLSFLLDAPAGKHGFLKAVKDHFEFTGQPGVPVRFWGANVCMKALFSSQKDNQDMLDDFVAMGYNSLRLHHFDGLLTKDTTLEHPFDAKRLNQLDYLLAEAKKRGIYVTLDLLTEAHHATMKQLSLSGHLTDYKWLCYMDPKVRKAFCDVAIRLLSHVNPYTGLAWKDDPMFITINLINEGTLTARPLRGQIKEAAHQAFQRYLAQQNIPMDDHAFQKHWSGFLEYTGKEFYADMKKKLKAIGVRIPLSDQNFADPALETRAAYDFVDTHLYWSHPMFIGKKTWNLPSYTNPTSAISASAGGIRDVLHTRFIGRPMTVTEWGYCYPNPHNFEGPLLTAAYAALHDYSGLWQFCYSHHPQVAQPAFLGAFDYRSNPVMKLAARIGALMFLRQDVGQAKTVIAGSREALRLLDHGVRLAVKIGRYIPGESVADAVILTPQDSLPPPTAGTVLRITGRQDARAQLLAKHLISPIASDGTIVSETGQLSITPKTSTFKVVTPRQEAFLLGKRQAQHGQFMEVKNGDAFAAVTLASLDGQELTHSNRLMLLHLTDVKSQGAVFRDASLTILENYGTGKLLLRKNRAKIQLNTPHPYRIFACAPNGARLFEVKPARKGNHLVFTADNTVTSGIVLYDLIRENH